MMSPLSPATSSPSVPHQSVICVHVVDDDPVVRTALGALVERMGCRWLGHGSGEEFLAAYEPSVASCLLLDVNLPGMNGLDLLVELEARSAVLPTLVFSADAEVERIVAAIQRGAVGFLQKPIDPRRLRDHLQALIAEAGPMVTWRQRAMWVQKAIAALTTREREVFHLMLAGRSAKQIAMELGLRGRTAHIHRTNVLRKMRVDTVLELVMLVGASPASQVS